MSSHCGRYPGCGCSSVVGTKCHLPDNDPSLKEKEPEFSDAVEAAKRMEELKYFPPPKHSKPTNYTPPKKKRKKNRNHRTT